MTNKEQKIKEEVEKTLQLFENTGEIEPVPFLFTRIKVKLQSSSTSDKNMISLLKEKILPAVVIIILIVLNTVSITGYLQSNEQNTKYRSEYVSAFAKQYSLASKSNDYLSTIIKGE